MAKIHSKSNEFDLALSFIEELKATEEHIDATILKINILNKNNNTLNSLSLIQSLFASHPFHWNVHETAKKHFKPIQPTILMH